MKRVLIGLLVVALLLLIGGCDSTAISPPDTSAPDTSQPPEVSEPEVSEPEPEPEPVFIDVPLSYEVIDSYIETDTYQERRRMVIGDVVIQDEVVEVAFPIGCVAVQNMDDVAGTFTVCFSFYGLDGFRADAHREVFGELDNQTIKVLGTAYSGNTSLSLEAGQEDLAQFPVLDIDMNEDEWLWEFEVIPSTKLVEQ